MANSTQSSPPSPTAKKRTLPLDINMDFGQSSDPTTSESKDEDLLKYVTSVNIPCGVHDGSPAYIMKQIAEGKKHLKALGAHIAYPDPKNFGYDAMELDDDELEAWILLQLGAFSAFCRAYGADIEHIRPHGALYAQFVSNEQVARVVIKAVKRFDPWTNLVVPMGPLADKLQAEGGVQLAQELYLGKRISSEGQLILDRFSDNLSPQGAIEQVKQLFTQSSITTEEGSVIPVDCKTIHVTRKLPGWKMVAERVYTLLDNPMSLSMSAAGSSGWL